MINSHKNLLTLLSEIEYLTKPLGMTLANKKRPFRRRLFWTVILWADLVWMCAVSLIPTRNKKLLFSFGDTGYYALGTSRRMYTQMNIFFRFNSALIATIYCTQRLEWLHSANQIYVQLTNVDIAKRCDSYVKRCQTLFLVVYLYSLLLVSYISYISIVRFGQHQYSNHFLWIFWNSSTSLISLMIIFQSWISVFFFCKVSIRLFGYHNKQFYKNVVEARHFNAFGVHFRIFNKICLFVHNVNRFIRSVYIVYFMCSLCGIASIYYIVFYSLVQLTFKLIFFVNMIMLLSVLVEMSTIIGKIDDHAKRIYDDIYKEFIIERQCITDKCTKLLVCLKYSNRIPKRTKATTKLIKSLKH